MQIWSWGATVLLLVLGYLLLVMIEPFVSPFVPPGLRKLEIGVLALVCLMPYLFWRVLFPAAIDLTVTKDSVCYEFRDPNYAAAFAHLNCESDNQHDANEVAQSL